MSTEKIPEGGEAQFCVIYCPYCGTEYEAEEKDMHRHAQCEDCGQEVVVGTKTPTNVQLVRKIPGKGFRKGMNIPAKRKVVLSKSLVAQASAQAKWSAEKNSDDTRAAGIGVKKSDATRAAEIGMSLGGESQIEDAVGDAFMSSGGCLFLPFALLNPFFWMQIHYKSEAKRALLNGDLTRAQELKKTSTIFAVAGWILSVIVLVVLYFVVNNYNRRVFGNSLGVMLFQLSPP